MCHLAAFSLGGTVGGAPLGRLVSGLPGGAAGLVRIEALLPALLMVPGGSLVVWPAVVGCGFLAGWQEGDDRRSLRSAEADDPWSPARSLNWEGSCLFRATGWPSEAAGDRWRLPAIILAVGPGRGELVPSRGSGVLLTGEGKPPTPGSVFACRVAIRRPDRARVPGGFDYRRFLAGRGLGFLGRLDGDLKTDFPPDALGRGGASFAAIRQELSSGIDTLLPPREAALAGAVLLGAKSADHRRLGASFTDLGLAHLFAVSGLHVGILLGIFTLPGRITGAGPWGRYLPLLIILPVYAVLTGVPGSVVRAVGLSLLAFAGPVVGSRAQALRLLGFLFWVGAVWEPRQVLDTGLQLSYLAAGGILAVSSLTDGFRLAAHPAGRILTTGLAVSVAAQWFTLPVVAASFGRISLLSPLANLLVVPAFGVGVWVTAAGLALQSVWPAGAAWAGTWSFLVFRGLAAGVKLVNDGVGGIPLGLPVPGPPTVVLWALLTALGLVLLEARRRGWRTRVAFPALAVILVLGLGIMGPWSRSLSKGRAVLWTFDVGQGDCSLLVLPDGWTALVDTGGVLGMPRPGAPTHFERSVAPYLVREGVRHIDAVILTHGHLDHTGGCGTLTDDFTVEAWYCGGRSHRAVRDSTARIISPDSGRLTIHDIGAWTVELLTPPDPPGDHPNENNFSLVTVVRRDALVAAVMSGDLETEGEHALMEAGLVPRAAQVWKAGHHGSATSGSRSFLDALDPSLVLVSCGVENKYGHPSHGTYVVAGDTIPILRTDLGGSLRLVWESDGKIGPIFTALGGTP